MANAFGEYKVKADGMGERLVECELRPSKEDVLPLPAVTWKEEAFWRITGSCIHAFSPRIGND